MNKVEALPQLVDPTEFNLSDIETNESLLRELNKKPSKKKIGNLKSTLGDSLPIWNSGSSNDKGYYWIEHQGRIVWLVKYEVIKRNWLPNHTTTQVALWRGGTVIFSSQASSKLFFNIVFKRTGCILSDRVQTEDGKRFWTSRIRDSLQKKLHVALVDFSKKLITEVSSLRDVENLSDSAWGNMRSNQNLRWMIWK